MKRFACRAALLATLVIGSVLEQSPTANAQPQPAPTVATLAPADSYFGRFRMSVLGIRNAIHDIAVRIDSASVTDLAMLYHKLTIVEEATLDLKDRYPNDSWLPHFGLALAQTFARMPYPAAQVHANDELDWVIADYPRSNEAVHADDIRRARLVPPLTMEIPIEPEAPPSEPAVPSYAQQP